MKDNERKQNVVILRDYLKFDALRRQAFELGYDHARQGKVLDIPAYYQTDEAAFYLAGFNIARNQSAFDCMAKVEKQVITKLFNLEN